MAKSNRMSVQKRLREKKKAEAAALKREMRATARPAEDEEPRSDVASRDDMAGYGLIEEEEAEGESAEG